MMNIYLYNFFLLQLYTVSELIVEVVVLVLSVAMTCCKGLTAGGGALVNILVHYKHNEKLKNNYILKNTQIVKSMLPIIRAYTYG